MHVYCFYFLSLIGAGLIHRWAQRYLPRPWSFFAGCVLPVAGLAIFMWNVSEPLTVLSDFRKAYYPAGRFILDEPSSLYAERFDHFVNLPIVAWLFVPFSYLKRVAAIQVMMVLGWVVAALACYGLIRLAHLNGRNRVIFIGFFVASGPLFNSLREGNSSHFVLCLLIAMAWCMERRDDVWAGVWLSLALIMKPVLALLAILFFLRRRWKLISGCAGMTSVIVGFSLFFYGILLHQTWFLRCIVRPVINPIGAFNVQSINGFVARLVWEGNGHLMDWSFQEHYLSTEYSVLRITLLALLIGMAILVHWRSGAPQQPHEQRLEFSSILCLSLLISPVTWSHYYLFLLLPFALFLGGRLGIAYGSPLARWVWVGIVLISPPVVQITTDIPIIYEAFSRWFISHYFFGGVVLFFVFLIARMSYVKNHASN